MKSKPMLAIFFTVFLGFIGISLPFPIFAHLILKSNVLLGEGTSLDIRHFLLGVTLSVYPFGQFLGAPILGQLSDRFGRKKLLLVSLIGTFLGHLATAIFFIFPSFTGLLAARFVCGLMEGNIAIAQSAAADLGRGNTEIKTKNFSLINSASYLGFLFGPIIGGVFGEPKFGFPYFAPFIIAACFSLFTFSFIYLFFNDPYAPSQKAKVHFFSGFMNLLKCWKTPRLNMLYLLNFLLFVSMYFYFQFYSPYCVSSFGFSPFWVALVSAYLSLSMTLAQTFIVGKLSKRLQAKKTLVLSSLFAAILLIITAIFTSTWVFLIALPMIGIFFAANMTNISVLISNTADDALQGEAMGVTQSTQVLGEGAVCLFGGFAASLYIGAPFIIGAIISIIACGLTIKFLFSKTYS